MPLYDFRCASHGRFEVLGKPGTHRRPCPDCGEMSPMVMAFAPARPPRQQGWVADFELPADLRQAHEDAVGWKAEAEAHQREYVGNGWKPRD